MIDLNLLRNQPETIIALIKSKEPSFDIARLIELDEKVRRLRVVCEQLRKQKNDFAQAGKKGVTQELRDQSIKLAQEIKAHEEQLASIEQAFNELYLSCPNVPSVDLPIGNKEANKVVFEWGEKRAFPFAPKNHLELANALGWFDFPAAAQMTGGQFALYKGIAVRLMYALTRFMIEHNQKHGYELVLPPYLVNEKSLLTASNFPKFRDQVYHIPADGLYLSPTAEVNLVNLYREAIISKEELPMRFTAWTSCFRREAGGYGAHERGLIRIHQFEKVELFAFCQPTQSGHELDKMVTCARALLEQLGLHYRISLLATQDCSFASARTYDIEVWMPGQNAYYEVSSCSNCTDFQARRGSIRFRPDVSSKPELVHTVNGSSLALPRLVVALMETYQQPDGTIALPEVLRQYGL